MKKDYSQVNILFILYFSSRDTTPDKKVVYCSVHFAQWHPGNNIAKTKHGDATIYPAGR